MAMVVVMVSAPIQKDPSPAAVQMGSNSTLMAGDVMVRDCSYSVGSILHRARDVIQLSPFIVCGYIYVELVILVAVHSEMQSSVVSTHSVKRQHALFKY